jgi:ribonuclease HI
MSKYTVIVHTDGGCSPNPGKGAAGAVLKLYVRGKLTKRRKVSWYLGDTTNNAAELTAVYNAVCLIKNKVNVDLEIYLDSAWVSDRIQGKHKRLKKYIKLSGLITVELSKFATVKVVQIPREENTVADGLVQLTKATEANIDTTEVI